MDNLGRELTLKINYSDLATTGRMVSIFCPYLILNKTGVDLCFSSKSLITSNRLTAGQSIVMLI
jgi:vacuolar protein sorting-associated protein 13A/C